MAGNLLNWMRTKAQPVHNITLSAHVCEFVVGGVRCAIKPERGYSYLNKSDKNKFFSLLIG